MRRQVLLGEDELVYQPYPTINDGLVEAVASIDRVTQELHNCIKVATVLVRSVLPCKGNQKLEFLF